MEQEKKEIWRDIEDYEGHYAISTLGVVKSIGRVIIDKNGREKETLDRILKPSLYGNYPTVGLSKSGLSKAKKIHRLMVFTFWDLIDGCVDPRIHPELEVNHKNGKKHDYSLFNLELVTRSQNLIHSFQVIGNKPTPGPKGELSSKAKLTSSDVHELYTFLGTGGDYKAFAKSKGVSVTCIQKILYGETWGSLNIDWSKVYTKTHKNGK